MKFTAIQKSVLTGYCPWDTERILRAIEAGTAPSEFPGDFTFVAEGTGEDGQPQTVMLTSAMSSYQYFYMFDGRRFFHGPNVFSILQESGVKWKWNVRAVNSLALTDYLIGGDSLHADIKRADAACLYLWNKDGLTIQPDPFPKVIFAQPLTRDSEPSHQALNEIMDELCARHPLCVSLSSGFDSRMMLATCLARGVKPIAGTMGAEDSTDVRIAKDMTRRFGLEHRVVEVEVGDYLNSVDEVLTLTGGTKTTAHWHTYIFAKKVAFPKDHLHVTGANTGISRLVFFDKGSLAYLCDWTPYPLLYPYFSLKYAPWRKMPGFKKTSFFRGSDAFPLKAVAANCAGVCTGVRGFLNQLDYYFVFQRERNFIGNGMTLFNSQSPTYAPCADYRFLRPVAAMPRKYKLNVRFHREAIERSVPELLDFPCDDTGLPLRDIDRPFYWRHKRKSVHYSPIDALLDHPDIQDVLRGSPHLDLFIDRPDRDLFMRQRNKQVLHFLVTMHFLVQKLHDMRLL